ncbi:glycosyltransferase family 2 protein [Fuscovulum blasticum]|uniref:glycosyltransferase family 2 protein n=1 Tax=Fuscovulum blasticum TaxID=1075 RepID=UPI000D3ED7AC|nr:glycosyltransferase family 2 protein [Fuscovulum blasticum]AWD22404.1 hypothetical protein B6K69_12575 [Fuscovulum blasticum]
MTEALPPEDPPACVDWALVATIKAPQDQVLAFLAHHLDLGAAAITLCFDDPDDPAIAAVQDIPRVSVLRCTPDYWARVGNGIRPDRHQNRQARNALRAWRLCPLPWIGHIDVDEFLLPDRPMGEILASAPAHHPMVRLEPFEAMHDPSLPDDIFTARLFRGPLKGPRAFLRDIIFGRYAAAMPNGMLSHSVGKAFFRTGVPGFTPRLHGGSMNGVRMDGPPMDRRVKLLHFHAQDRAKWTAALPFRLARGAYQKNEALLQALSGATPDKIDAFYTATQMLTPEMAEILWQEGRLVEVNLDLRRKVADLLAQS